MAGAFRPFLQISGVAMLSYLGIGVLNYLHLWWPLPSLALAAPLPVLIEVAGVPADWVKIEYGGQVSLFPHREVPPLRYASLTYFIVNLKQSEVRYPMRKLVSLALAGALCLGSAMPALADDHDREEHGHHRDRFEIQFKDWQQGYWGNEALARMITKGVMQGNGDATIAAVRPVTRLEAAIMLARLLDLKAPQIPEGEFEIQAPWGVIKIQNEDGKFEFKIKTREGEYEFDDENEIPTWGREAILIGLQHDFLLFEGAHLSPLAPLNRLEAAIMLVKAAGLDADAKAKAGAALTFKDADKIPDSLKGYISIAVEKGFVNGYDDGTFKPAQILDRAEWAALLDRLDRKGPDVSANGRQVKGNVTAVTVGAQPSITMTTPVFPGGVTYPVDDTAVFYKSGKPVTIADVAAGDQVIINLSTDRKVLMVTVNNVVTKVTGTVTTFTAPTATASGSLTVTADGKATTLTVPADTAVSLAGATAKLADILVGDKVDLTLEGAHLKQIGIKVETVTVIGTLGAVVVGANGSLPTLSVVGADSKTVTYTVGDAATIQSATGAGLTLADLKAGDQLSLQVQRNLVIGITRK